MTALLGCANLLVAAFKSRSDNTAPYQPTSTAAAHGSVPPMLNPPEAIFCERAADFSFLSPLRPTLLFTAYWRFAAERQRVFFRRTLNSSPPWTPDPVLQHYKFTNAYRASDRVSQFLIRNVIYYGEQTPREIIFRILLFKFFNRIQTWERFVRDLGYPNADGYLTERYDRVLTNALERGERLYSAAYIMPTGGRHGAFTRKHRMHLDLLYRMLKDRLPEALSESSSMADAFSKLRTYSSIGDFLAYQYVTDVNYSTVTGFSECEFVVAGPGSLSGLRKCFSSTGGLTWPEVIRVVQERQTECFAAAEISFPDLWGRPLQLIDIQNLFCEVDKYSRVAYPRFTVPGSRSRIKQRFQASPVTSAMWYPPKWGINEKIDNGNFI